MFSRYLVAADAQIHAPRDGARRIAAGELPTSVARTVANLPEPKRTGMAIFLPANDPAALTAKEIKTCAGALKKWNGIQFGLAFAQQSHRNTARALARLWSQVVVAYSEDAYAAVTMLIYRGLHEEPWASAKQVRRPGTLRARQPAPKPTAQQWSTMSKQALICEYPGPQAFARLGCGRPIDSLPPAESERRRTSGPM